MLDLEHELNEPQRRVVTTTNGPVLVLAGAGSGKTRSVIFRTAYLIREMKVAPYHILIVTFTNKAAQELKQRLQQNFSIRPYDLWVGTFHSICVRILREEAKYLPFPSNFTIYDTDDQKALLKKIYKQLNIDTTHLPVGKMLEIIGRRKDQLLLPEDLQDMEMDRPFAKLFLQIYSAYQQSLQQYQALDFDDLLLYTVKLLETHEEVRNKYERLFQYVMIDEYQDTNFAQFKFVDLIAGRHGNLCVVGDDDQAIYSWRGANIRNILDFEKNYRKVTVIRLEENYRSTTAILDLANSLIKYNRSRHSKELWTQQKGGRKPILEILENENEEAMTVAQHIQDLVWKTNTKLADCVVLYRTNAQSRVFEATFLQERIPYQIVGGVNFYQRKEIKDILGYLRVLYNPNDTENLLRIINNPGRGIGDTTISKLVDFAVKQRISLFEALGHVDKVESLNRGTIQKLQLFHRKLIDWQVLASQENVTILIKAILDDLDWIAIYENSKDPKDYSRAENLSEFVSAAEEFMEKFIRDNDREPILHDYLSLVSLQSDIDRLNEDADSVKLMTMHNAKGLEFDYVFIVGLEQGLLPHQMSMDSNEDIEEERRLLYVAITRARKEVYLSLAKWRRTYDSMNRTMPSQFLKEMDSGLLDRDAQSFYAIRQPSNPEKVKKPVILESEKHFRIGQKVFHDEYGKGIILNVEGRGEDAHLTVSFANGNLKKIIGSYLRIE
ncbi:MAG TPA: UvrD-helicase domain-containing protein [Candidatus Cloacimonadota bacterium]|nr:UvrD-helicase domain-containing protein [Candidatus Cloacimonadota bacterium]HPT72324.1 UvrD-helicase domain-containing protein [Candidatus Cloacimonadota bacterium]